MNGHEQDSAGVCMSEPFLVTFGLNGFWPELDWEWMVVPNKSANEDRLSE
jgi:hypothetical protein